MSAAEITSKKRRWIVAILPVMLLVCMASVAYVNLWPSALVLDDRFFVGNERISSLSDIPRFFSQDLWADSGVRSGHYRPMLLISILADTKLYGQWLPGYRLTNILLHVLVTVAVFGFVNQLLRVAGVNASPSLRYAWLAALIFAVHPIHTEAVNSVFNRSGMLVALSAVLGLRWLLVHFRSRPVRAWSGLALAYLFAMFSKESGVVLPGIAIALILILTPGDWRIRVRKCLPALGLVIPLALYFVLRDTALVAPGRASTAPAPGVAELRVFDWLPQAQVLLQAAGVWGESLRALIWPHPLVLYHGTPAMWFQWTALILHSVLVATALFQARKKRFGLLIGLVIFYLALLPASRIVGAPGDLPHLAERYLYFPSVGLAATMAFGLRYVGHRFGTWAADAPVLIAALVLMALCWARNTEWRDEVTLYEAEYRKESRSIAVLRLLTTAHLQVGNHTRIADLCDTHAEAQAYAERFSNHCGIAYARLDRNEAAERAFLFATQGERGQFDAHTNLANFYLAQKRRGEAREQFELAIEEEKSPAMRAYLRGELIIRLDPRTRSNLTEARMHFEEALRLQPGFRAAGAWKQRLDQALDSP